MRNIVAGTKSEGREPGFEYDEKISCQFARPG